MKTNLVRRTYLIESREHRRKEKGVGTGRRGFIETAYSTVSILPSSSYSSSLDTGESSTFESLPLEYSYMYMYIYAYSRLIDLFNKQHDIGIYIASDIMRFAIRDSEKIGGDRRNPIGFIEILALHF